MHALRSQVANQYHECVPLGWAPVPVAGTYYPGYSAELQETNSWLRPLWLGSVQTSDLQRPAVRATFEVLNELAHVGMLESRRVPGGFRYRLTLRALPYYFDENQYGNNPEHWPYLCYSLIVPQRVVWNQPIQLERHGYRPSASEAFRVGFQWRPSQVASWSNNAILRSHSVILAPTASPLIATFAKRDGAWIIQHLSAPVPFRPQVIDSSVWPQLRT